MSLMILVAVAVLIIVLALAFVLISSWASMRGVDAKAKKQADAALRGVVDWEAIADDELQSYLPDQKIAAIKRYRELTGTGLAVAKNAIEYAIANPDGAKKRSPELAEGGEGVRDLILEGRIEEAVKVYAAFMGVDPFTARDAVEAMADELLIEDEGETQQKRSQYSSFND